MEHVSPSVRSHIVERRSKLAVILCRKIFYSVISQICYFSRLFVPSC